MKKITLLTVYIVILSQLISAQNLKGGFIPISKGNRDIPGSLVELNKLLSPDGIEIEWVAIENREAEKSILSGIVDIALLPAGRTVEKLTLPMIPLKGDVYITVAREGFILNERSLIDLKTIGVLKVDQGALEEELIDNFSLSPRMQLLRHYDLLLRSLDSGRVTAIFLPFSEFQRAKERTGVKNEDLSHPLLLSRSSQILLLSPSQMRLFDILKNMKNKGILENLDQS